MSIESRVKVDGIFEVLLRDVLEFFDIDSTYEFPEHSKHYYSATPNRYIMQSPNSFTLSIVDVDSADYGFTNEGRRANPLPELRVDSTEAKSLINGAFKVPIEGCTLSLYPLDSANGSEVLLGLISRYRLHINK